MAPRQSKQKDSIEQFTVRLDRSIPEQGRALAIYEEMLQYHPRAKGLGTLFPDVLTVLADIARDHPALSNKAARLIHKHQDKVMELIRKLEAGEEVPGLDEVTSPPPPPPAAAAPPPPAAPKPQPKPQPQPKPLPPAASNGSGGDIEIDFSKLSA